MQDTTIPPAPTGKRKWKIEIDLEELVAEYQAGASIYALAQKHGVYRATIVSRLRFCGVEVRDQAEVNRLKTQHMAEAGRSHRLSSIDPLGRRATCAKCGPVPICRGGKGGEWMCSRHRAIHRKRTRQRRRIQALNGTRSCSRCGFEASHPAQLDVHHRDYDHSNNDPKNLEVICANCHRLEHSKDDPVWQWDLSA